MEPAFRTVEWRDGQLRIIDQTKLPLQIEYVHLKSVEDVWQAIRNLQVRGANALGITAGYGLYIGAAEITANTQSEFLRQFEKLAQYLGTSRPTAVYLFWVINRIREKVRAYRPDDSAGSFEGGSAGGAVVSQLKAIILNEAIAIHKEDIARCRAIGDFGVQFIKDGAGVLTHCNAGALGTTQYGTALAPMYVAKEQGVQFRVFADETRPVLQGARLTTWELSQAGIDVTLICDNMAASVMQKGWINVVFVGADRIAANGDTANKIGTYGVAVLAKEHGIPFYVAAPTSTIDMNTRCGADIAIEERAAEEITNGLGRRIAPQGVKVFNPAFDVTPSELIAGIITNRGVIHAPFKQNIAKIMAR